MTRPTDHACHEQNQWPEYLAANPAIANHHIRSRPMKDIDRTDPAAAVLDILSIGVDEIDYSEARLPFLDLTSYTDEERDRAARILLGSPEEDDRVMAVWWLGMGEEAANV